MKRYTYARSHTFISPKIKLPSRMNSIKTKLKNKKEIDDIKIGHQLKNYIDNNLNLNNQNPNRSGKKLFS